MVECARYRMKGLQAGGLSLYAEILVATQLCQPAACCIRSES